MSFGSCQAFYQAVKQHLYQLNIVSTGNTGGDLYVAIASKGTFSHVHGLSLLDESLRQTMYRQLLGRLERYSKRPLPNQ
jgi:hypothetical protein